MAFSIETLEQPTLRIGCYDTGTVYGRDLPGLNIGILDLYGEVCER